MAITLEQLKQVIIDGESIWINEVYEDDGEDPQPYVQGMIDEVSSCDSIEDLVDWYAKKGYTINEAYESVIVNLMQYGTIIAG